MASYGLKNKNLRKLWTELKEEGYGKTHTIKAKQQIKRDTLAISSTIDDAIVKKHMRNEKEHLEIEYWEQSRKKKDASQLRKKKKQEYWSVGKDLSDEENKQKREKHKKTFLWYAPIISKAFDEEEKKFMNNKMIKLEKRFQ